MRRSTKGYVKPKADEWIMRDGWTMPDSPCVNGHAWPRNRFGHCVKCVREYRARKGHFLKVPSSVTWRSSNKDKTNALRRDHAKRRPEMKMIASAKGSAKRKGIPFSLEVGDFDTPKVCPVLGVELHYSLGTRQDATASLDRISPEFGYVKGNVIVVCWRVNRIKCDATIEELERVAKFYKRLQQMPLLKD